jgi:pimeloyl-ACP methyl ester carboxylesterase
MASFSHQGVTLAYDDIPGAGDPVLLVHGFTSNRREAWRRTGWYAALQGRGQRVVAMDLRGHGESEKLHDPDAYGAENLASDVIALLDHLGLPRVDLVGYSMGSRVAMAVAEQAPERVSRMVLGGVGGTWAREDVPERNVAGRRAIAEAMLSATIDDIAEPTMRSFRIFVDEQGEDPRAMAACALALSTAPTAEALGRITIPVLVAAGSRDRIAGDPQELAQAFPSGVSVTLAGCDHFSAIPHALTKAAVFDFFDGLLEADPDPFARSF